MDDAIAMPSPAGELIIRPEREDDHAFRFRLFCSSRQPEFAQLLAPDVFQAIMRQQFHAQTASYRAAFPRARFDIIELAGQPIGRIVVDRPGTLLHIVDQAIVPELRNRGICTAIMRGLMDEARQANLPVGLTVATENQGALRLYLRLGFVPIETASSDMRLEWRPDATTTGR